MRYLTMGLIAVGAAAMMFAGLRAITVDGDTAVTVLAADEVVLHLPVSPSVDRIVTDLKAELSRVALSTSDDRVADALVRIRDDATLLNDVAAKPVDMFDNGAAAATATAVYDIQLERDLVTVTVVTVELVPAYGSTGRSRDHEAGHALINEKMTKRCAEEVLQRSVELGSSGDILIAQMVSGLSAAADPVHNAYHRYAEGANYGQHLQHARKALADVTGC